MKDNNKFNFFQQLSQTPVATLSQKNICRPMRKVDSGHNYAEAQ